MLFLNICVCREYISFWVVRSAFLLDVSPRPGLHVGFQIFEIGRNMPEIYKLQADGVFWSKFSTPVKTR